MYLLGFNQYISMSKLNDWSQFRLRLHVLIHQPLMQETVQLAPVPWSSLLDLKKTLMLLVDWRLGPWVPLNLKPELDILREYKNVKLNKENLTFACFLLWRISACPRCRGQTDYRRSSSSHSSPSSCSLPCTSHWAHIHRPHWCWRCNSALVPPLQSSWSCPGQHR